MKTRTTDLEQIEQFRTLYAQLGMAIKQIENYQTRIVLAELMKEQSDLGMADQPEAEDVVSLEKQIIITMKSIRNRSSHFIKELMDISKRAEKENRGRSRRDSNGEAIEAHVEPEAEPEAEQAPEPERPAPEKEIPIKKSGRKSKPEIEFEIQNE